ncbi:tetratricopeptide repeat protein [Streptomyces sp. HB2AG]|uniref:tetratricopeptide repeat protein n=1 Tax=Streptomyces sp. HB2AG TaxID=2983400 RepID=UPI0022AA76F3|nr:tetratricopeptide repeat protein [Streptomyces sp. HB2AG]MCZ2527991.1 tetratricopeptide repeat protein [Streptomyces sp. HB2AG]
MTLETPEAVFEALRENDRRPYGRQRTVVAEELVEAAGQFEDRGALVTALLELMEAYEYSGENRKSPVVFARVLKLWEEQPDSFSEWEARQVFWRFKWVTTSLLQVPEVPLESILGWTREMRDRYRAAGHGVQPVYAMRYHVAAHTGVDADDAFDLWTTRPRTELSDCEACEIRLRALHHVGRGDDGRALEVWRPVLDGRAGCSEEPYLSHGHSLLPLLRTGRADEARSGHLTGYRFCRGKSNMAEQIGLHLEFCVLTRNEGRALEVLAENRALFDGTGAPLSHLDFLTGVELLLARLAADGHADLAVGGPAGTNWTARTLLEKVRSDADALAAKFDARNGTTAVGDRRRARLAQQPLTAEPLALGVRSAAAAPAPAPAVPAVPPAAADAPEDFAELVSRARELSAALHPHAAALWELVAERAAADGHVHDPALGPVEQLRGELALQRGLAARGADDAAAALAALTEAAELFEEAGLPGHAVAARARAATALREQARKAADAQGTDGAQAADGADGAGDAGAGLAAAREQLDAALARAEELLAGPDGLEPRHWLTVLLCRASLAHDELTGLGDEAPGGVREAFGAAVSVLLSEAGRLGVPHRAADALQYRADAAAREGRLDEAVADLERSLELLEEAGQPWLTARALGLFGQVRLRQGMPEESIRLVHRALAEAARWDDEDFPVAPSHVLLGHAAAQSGDTAGAVRHLSEAASRFDREGEDESAAGIRLQLADVLTEAGRDGDAVAVLESVLLDGGESLHPRLAAQVRLNLARGLRGLGEHRASAEEFLRLADAVSGWEEQHTHTMVACEAAVALAEAGRPDAARAAYDRAVQSHRAAPGTPHVTGMMREFARLAVDAAGPDGLEEALGHLSAAEEVCADADAAAGPDAGAADFTAWYETGMIRHRRALCLADAGKHEDAVAELDRAVTVFEAGGEEAEAPRAESVRIAALLEGNALGRTAAALSRLDSTIARCERAGLPHAVEILRALRARLAAQPSG